MDGPKTWLYGYMIAPVFVSIYDVIPIGILRK